LRDNNCIGFAFTFQTLQYIFTSIIRYSSL